MTAHNSHPAVTANYSLQFKMWNFLLSIYYIITIHFDKCEIFLGILETFYFVRAYIFFFSF